MACVLWCLLAGAAVAWSVVRGVRLQNSHPEVRLGAAPLISRRERRGWDWRWSWSIVLASSVVVAVAWGTWRRWWSRLTWRVLVLVAALGGAGFAAALAAVDGISGFTRGINHPSEYLAGLADMPPAGEFVDTFVERINDYLVHVRGHPPGVMLTLRLLDRLGLGGSWPLAVGAVASTAVTVGATLVVVRAVAGARLARRVVPLLVLAPSVIWMVSSADAMFTAVGMTATAALAVAVTTARRRVSVALAVLGGLLLGWMLFLTYLAAVFAIIPAAVVAAVARRRRSWRPIRLGLAALAGAAVVVGAFARAGFWWLDGARATRHEYLEGTPLRSWHYFRVANLAVLAIALGPVVVAGGWWVRTRRAWWLIGAAALAVLTMHLSTYTKGEVERIWLPFLPLLTVAGAGALDAAGRRGRAVATSAVLVQGAYGVVLHAALLAKW